MEYSYGRFPVLQSGGLPFSVNWAPGASGLYMKPGLLAAAFVGQLAIMIACLSMFYHLVETGKYPGYTGMEGIALVIFPAIYVTSLLISVIIYLVAAYVSRRRRGQ
jgi:ABC-type antimicrobial peptide transport system permease subunit